jgi:hypothetical protein
MNAIVERWEKTHLLDELDDVDKSRCATRLQECADLLIGKRKDFMKKIDEAIGEEGFMAGYILPIVRRLYETKELASKSSKKSIEWLMEDFGEYSKRMYHVCKDLEKYHQVDGGAEFVHLYMMHLKEQL